MSAYLAYSYSACLMEKEQAAIDKKVIKNRENFCRGFRTGTEISLSILAIYSRANAAYAADSVPDQTPVPPVPDQTPAPKSVPTSNLAPTTPGFKPLPERTKGAITGAIGTICVSAAQSGDFLLGLSCGFLIIVAAVIMNRPEKSVCS